MNYPSTRNVWRSEGPPPLFRPFTQSGLGLLSPVALIDTPIKCISGSTGLTLMINLQKFIFFINVFGINDKFLAERRAAGMVSG